MNTYENILVSTIMCVYNTPFEYISLAVESILKQTHHNFELLIVDDCSEAAYYNEPIFSDPRITIIRNSENKGAAFSRNQALKIAKGKYIAIMDSDDYSLPERFEEQIAFMENHLDVVACGTWFKHFGAKDNTIERSIDDNDYYKCCLLFGNYPTLLNPSAMIRKKVLDDNNICYDERLRLGQDYGLWVDLIKFGKLTNLKKVLVNYRIHPNQVTNENYKRRQTLKYDAIVRIKQLDSISSNFTDEEKKIFSKHYSDKSVKLVAYYNLLKKIFKENEIRQNYNPVSLKKRIREQWAMKIKTVNNPFKLFVAVLLKPKELIFVTKIKFKQLFRKQ